MNNLILALQITLVGMSLVFASIVLLWGVIALIMRFGSPKEEALTGDISPEDALQAAPDAASETERRRRAAAAAVAVALAREQVAEAHVFPLPSTALVSAWQAVMRANNLTKRGPVR